MRSPRTTPGKRQGRDRTRAPSLRRRGRSARLSPRRRPPMPIFPRRGNARPKAASDAKSAAPMTANAVSWMRPWSVAGAALLVGSVANARKHMASPARARRTEAADPAGAGRRLARRPRPKRTSSSAAGKEGCRHREAQGAQGQAARPVTGRGRQRVPAERAQEVALKEGQDRHHAGEDHRADDPAEGGGPRPTDAPHARASPMLPASRTRENDSR